MALGEGLGTLYVEIGDPHSELVDVAFAGNKVDHRILALAEQGHPDQAVAAARATLVIVASYISVLVLLYLFLPEPLLELFRSRDIRPADFEAIKEAIDKASIPYIDAEVTMLPQNTTNLAGKEAEQMVRLMEMLEDCDDVQKVYTNADIPEEMI